MSRSPAPSEPSAAAIVRPGGSWPCDDRARVVDGGRLCLVADGSGPTYGGYHEPFALDPGLDAIAAALAPDRHADHPCGEACVADAFAEANRLMWGAQAAHLRAFQEELAGAADDRLQASLRAGQRVARECFGRTIDTLAHAAGSVTALYLDGAGQAIVGQVGLGRAYHYRRGVLELLLPDDGVRERRPDVPDDFYYGMAAQLLGFSPAVNVGTRVLACEAGDRFVLCTDGVWTVAGEDAIADACRRVRADDVAAAIASAIDPMRDDAALIAVALA